MKKRILSALLITTMLLASSVCAFAVPSEDAVLGKVGAVLDELNYDAEYGVWQKDIDYHAAQLAPISVANGNVDAADISEAVEMVLNHSGLTERQKLYLCALVKAEGDPAVDAILRYNDTSNLSWKDSFNLLKDYADYLKDNHDTIVLGGEAEVAIAYDEILADATQKATLAGYIEAALKALLKVAFVDTSDKLIDNYYDAVLAEDLVKKTLVILASESVNKELPYYSSESLSELAGFAKDYALSFKNEANVALAMDAADRIARDDYEDAVKLAFDEAARGVKEVNNGYFTEPVRADFFSDIELILGDGTSEGLVETLVKAVDEDFEAVNMLLNIALSKGVQVHTVAGPVADIKENTADAATFSNVTLRHENSIIFKTLDPSSTGLVETGAITLRTHWFDIKFFDEDGAELDKITYSDGQISIVKDVARGVKNAYMVLYRQDAEGEEKTFIESYPVKIDFTEGTPGTTPSRPSYSTTTMYTVTFETNGGDALAPQKYPAGVVVNINVIPTKEGYIFDGWYADAELTNKVESVKLSKNTTLYAAWKKDGSAVVSKVETPEMLEGGDHFAYVMGYPDGTILPNGNITRAEAVTMIFRILKDDVRQANITQENVFDDVTADDWFNTAVSTLAKIGLVEGRTATTFDPNANITRAEFATIFARMAENEFVANSVYGDIDGHWAKASIEEVDAYGWIAGYEDGTFRPDRRITRAEAMTLINRVLKRNPEINEDLLAEMKVWVDNADTTVWYYIAVQEASNSHEYTRKENGFETWTKLAENKDWTSFEK